MTLFPDGWQLGPLTLRLDVVAPLVVLLFAIWYMKRDANRQGLDGAKLSDLLFNAFAIGLIASRLSAFLIAPAASFRAPLVTLISGGVPYTGWVYLFVFVSVLVYGVQKNRLAWPAVLAVFARAAILIFGVFALFVPRVGKPTGLPWAVELSSGTYHPVNLYQAVLALALLVWLWRTIVPERPLSGFSRALFGFGAAMLLVSFFQVHLELTAGLAPVQWLWLLVAACGYFSLVFLGKTGQTRGEMLGE